MLPGEQLEVGKYTRSINLARLLNDDLLMLNLKCEIFVQITFGSIRQLNSLVCFGTIVIHQR